MSLSINVASTECRAGSQILGQVELSSENSLEVDDVELRLIGRCENQFVERNQGGGSWENQTTHRGQIILLDQKSTLKSEYSKPYTGQTWDFRSLMPNHCAIDPTNQENHVSGKGPQDPFKASPLKFNYDPHQALPPSFQDSTFGTMSEADCSVSYALEARANVRRSGDTRQIILKAEQTLQLSTRRDVESPDPDIAPAGLWFERSISASSTDLEVKKPSLKEKIKSFHSTKSVSRINVFLQHPTVAVIDESFPLFLRIMEDTKRSTASTCPPVTLRKVSLSLIAGTNVRSTQNTIAFSLSTPNDDPAFTYWEKKTLLDKCALPAAEDSDMSTRRHSSGVGTSPARASQVVQLTSEPLDLTTLLRCHIPPSVCPSFATFNICHSYRLGINVGIDCAGKYTELDFRTGNLNLLHPVYSPDLTSAGDVSTDMKVK